MKLQNVFQMVSGTKWATAIACVLALGMLTGCPTGDPAGGSTELSDGLQYISELTDEDGTVLFRSTSTVHNIATQKQGDPLFVLLREAPEIDLNGIAPAGDPLDKAGLLSFIENDWPGGSVDTFYQALLDFSINPEDLINIMDGSGMTPADALDVLESIHAAFPDNVAGSEALALFDWLADTEETLADFVAAIEAAGADVAEYLAHLSNMGLDAHSLRDMYAAYVDSRAAGATDTLDTFIALMGFAKSRQELSAEIASAKQAVAAAGVIVEVGKFAYDVVKNSHGATTSDDVSEYVDQNDTNWASYDRGTLSTSTFKWKVTEWPSVKVIDVTYKVIVYYDKRHSTFGGQYVSVAVIADSVWAGAVSSVEASASMSRPQQIGTPTNPIPQGFGKIKMQSWYLGISEATHTQSFTVYGDANWKWGNHPR